MKHTLSIFWSDLSYSKQESIKENIISELRENEILLAEITANQKAEADGTESSSVIDWRITNVLEDKAVEIILKTFTGVGECDY
jgi:hypothetical protein